MKTQDIRLGQNNVATGYEIDLPGAPLVAARGQKGFLMCGYLDLETVDKLGVAAAVVRGVKTVDELLERPVAGVSVAAARLGVAVGMTGREALEILA